MIHSIEEPGLFDEDLVKKYPKSNRRINLAVAKYGIITEPEEQQGQTVHISPHGMQFRSVKNYEAGDLLKIHISIPNYWERKQQFVDYNRIDTPHDFKILAKVVSTEEIGKRGKKKMVLVRTVNMDQIDEQVLKSFLQES